MGTDNDITAKRVMELVEAQNYRCPLSGRELTPNTASLDHKIPLSRGGAHTLDNIWILHREVNVAKGTLTAEEFVTLCREISNYQQATNAYPAIPSTPA